MRARAEHARHSPERGERPRILHARSWPIRGGAVLLGLGLGVGVGAVSAGSLPVNPASEPEAAAASSTAPDSVDAEASAIPAVTATAGSVEVEDATPVAEIEVVEDGPSIPDGALDDPTSFLVVVNKSRPLDPMTYAPEDLVNVEGVPGGSSERLRSEAAEALAQMRDAAVAEGLDFSIASGYRSYTEQISLHSLYVGRRGTTVAESFSARAGYSEHQTGWAADIYGSTSCRVKRCFADELIGAWVAENAWQYGWIVRYPKDEFDTTGYWYEPWHVRYVGVELSTWMHEQGITVLEEAVGLPAAPDYAD
ncbi:M15 family metallopeptidase [Demequina salsinemoris]|uniref:M15 family metallopeptidase n=1 Tax=Demequina salsinemoris TaxID=577470 RepID=UPI000780CD16|nr:M15 family metallopeptidase [Demequina salsinemoris]